MTAPQVESLRAYVERREHADHDTFCCGREFAAALLAEVDRLAVAPAGLREALVIARDALVLNGGWPGIVNSIDAALRQ